MTSSFFEAQREQSRVKTAIVSEYFSAWSSIIQSAVRDRPDKRMGYVDLFAGPGVYDDETPSTPIRILSSVLADEDKRRNVVTIFNDSEPDYVRTLAQAIDALDGISGLSYPPLILAKDASDAMIQARSALRHVPTLYFVDPIGYKGVTLGMLSEAIADWGSEVVLFFNYNRINQALTIDPVSQHIDAFFGSDRAENMRAEIKGRSPLERELYITEKAIDGLIEVGAKYVLPFRFKKADGSRTSHYLVFATKNFKGYDEMKRVMARQGDSGPDGVPCFEYCEADEAYPRLFAYTLSIAELQDMLLEAYAGRTVHLCDIYTVHSVGLPYVRSNYATALSALEDAERITVTRPPRSRAATFGDKTLVEFPPARRR